MSKRRDLRKPNVKKLGGVRKKEVVVVVSILAVSLDPDFNMSFCGRKWFFDIFRIV